MLSWTVYVDPINSKHGIGKYNIFCHAGFFEDCKKNYKKNRDNKEAFFERLSADLFYWFGGKCEWEIVIQPLFCRCESEGIKVDVKQQVRLNWEQFCGYVWANKEELKVEDKTRRRTRKTDSHI